MGLWGFLSIAVVCSMISSVFIAKSGKTHKGHLSKFQEVLDDVEDHQVELEQKLVQRENKVAELEERIRVLERIVTDPKSSLEEEFRKLGP